MTTIGTITYYEASDLPFPIPPSRRESACKEHGCTLLGRIHDDGSVHVDHVTPERGTDRRVFEADEVNQKTHMPHPSVLKPWLKDAHAETLTDS